ncbi:MAG: hypothetical protein LBB34_01240 [Holosporales bacterium]|nr:hypothetical protein [Holosporales bacterium]
MATNHKRITFAVTPDVKLILEKAKKEIFYNQSHSEMVRELVKMGSNFLSDGANHTQTKER